MTIVAPEAYKNPETTSRSRGPLAIGAVAAMKEAARERKAAARPVLLVTGDGAFGFYASEWNNAVLAGLPIIALISNDGGWGTERHGQAKASGRTVNVDLGTPRYDLVAEGFGCYAELVNRPLEVGPAMQRGFSEVQKRPVVLNIVTDQQAGALRKEDPRLQMIPFDDINASRRPHHTPPIA